MRAERGGRPWRPSARTCVGPCLRGWGRGKWLGGGVAGLGVLYALGYNGLCGGSRRSSALYANLGRSLVLGDGPVNGRGMYDHAPLGLPRLLGWIGGPGPAAQGLFLLMAAATLGLTFAVMRRATASAGSAWSRGFAAAVTLLTGLNVVFYRQSLDLLTEMPFALGLMLVLLGDEWRRPAEGTAGLRRRPVAGWTLMAVGFVGMAWFRSVAVVVAVTYAATSWTAAMADPRRRRRALWAGAVALVAAGGAWWLSAAVRDDLRLLVGELIPLDLPQYAASLWRLLTEHLVEATLGLDLGAVAALPVSLLLIVAGLSLVRWRRFWGVLWAVCLLQWVVFLPEIRYVGPLVPLLAAGLLTLVPRPRRASAAGGARRSWRPAALVCLGILVAGHLVATVDEIRDQRTAGWAWRWRPGGFLRGVSRWAFCRLGAGGGPVERGVPAADGHRHPAEI